MRGGAADRSGLIHVGDVLREVNGVPVDDKKPDEIIHILSQSQGAITFKLIPAIKEETPSKEPKMFVKTLFDYDPAEDKAIPCKEAGLAFKRGDILQIMSQDDANWWQAKQDGHANPRAGLIPSKQFQERFALRRPAAGVLQPQKISNRRSCKNVSQPHTLAASHTRSLTHSQPHTLTASQPHTHSLTPTAPEPGLLKGSPWGRVSGDYQPLGSCKPYLID
nr:MAGUK p55 subfamily member 7-like isoform X2 [Oncorhynchus nerka]